MEHAVDTVSDLELLHLAAVEVPVDGPATHFSGQRASSDDLDRTAGDVSRGRPFSDSGTAGSSSGVNTGSGKTASGRRNVTLMSEHQLPADVGRRTAAPKRMSDGNGPPAKPPETSSSVLTSTTTSAASAATSRGREQ